MLLNALGCPDGELSILIVDDSQIIKLNKEYLNRDKATNVIAFPMREGEFTDISPNLLGDVVISADTAEREALIGGITMEERFTQLMVHGILHLLGYDHEREGSDANKMEEKASELLQLLDGGK